MRFDFAMSEQELARELQEMERDYWPLTVEELPVGRPYPASTQISQRCTVFVHAWASRCVH